VRPNATRGRGSLARSQTQNCRDSRKSPSGRTRVVLCLHPYRWNSDNGGDYPSNLSFRVLLRAALSGVLSPEQQERQLHVAVRAGRCRELAATDIVIPAGAADDRQSCQVRGALGAKRTELASVQA
jgi:hypothetical protein